MSKTSIHTENTFETAIVEHLCENGWTLGAAGSFDKDSALDKRSILDFVQATQNAEWTRLTAFYKTDAEAKFFQRLNKELDLRGMLDVVRHGIAMMLKIGFQRKFTTAFIQMKIPK